ncbi:ABC transporter substrate-binding protein [Paraburkholderia sp. SG-MS1]|uniref:ABC transporter substrate-binding protein n=1 Tax=Paraburkholderia sp. SG-MS1 TaxID=2023741 RepID=UPI0014461690|nr:extracellular solute-binding protein [Paraburkholderia sp. SG-MS1]
MSSGKVSRREALRGIGGALLAPVLGRSANAFAADSSVVTIYSSMPSAYMTKLAEAFNAEKTGITLKIYSAATFQTVERLQAELRAGRVAADLFQVSDLSAFVTLKRQGALARYESETYKHYPAAYKDPDFMWINSRSLITLFAYNTKQISAADAPKSWDDFGSPKWAGKQGMADPRVDGDAYNWYYTLRKTKGVEWWKKYAKNKPQVFRGHGALIDKLVSGELPLTEQLDYIVYTNVRDRKAPIRSVFPPEVVPVTMTPLAVLKQAPNPDGARKVFDWFLSKRGQDLLQQIGGCYSVRDDVDDLPNRPAFSSFKTLSIDPEDFTNSREKLQEEFADIFGL